MGRKQKENKMENMIINIIVSVMSLVLALGVYFLPYISARINKHKNYSAIAVLNLFLGWTIIGWVIALVWAQTSNRAEK